MTLNVEQERNCHFCGKRLYGRSDKKYCDDNCRNNHHYNVKRNDGYLIKSVNASLLRNRELLKLLCIGGRSMVKKQLLLARGFDFCVMTSLYKTKKGTEYRMVYDYAYRFVNEDDVMLIRFGV